MSAIDHLADLRMPDSDLEHVNHPTDEQVERAFAALWQLHHDDNLDAKQVCQAVLLILLNKDRILGYR
jgi:hypothetical protein